MTEQEAQVDPTVMNNIYSTMTKERIISAIKELVNADQIVSDIRFQLTGKKQTKIMKDGKLLIQEVKYHEPLLNDFGANKLIADFRAYINPNVILSWFDKNEIGIWSEAYFSNVIFELSRNMITYGIHTRENHAKIRYILNVNFRAVLGRAYNGMTLLTSLKNISVQEVRSFDQDDRKGLTGVFRR